MTKMLIVYLLFLSFCLHVYSVNIIWSGEQRNNLSIICVTNILEQYFSKNGGLAYFNINSDDDDLLRAIHSTTAISLVSTTNASSKYEGYLVTSANTSDFTEHFPRLARERMWNPSARILIIIKTLREKNLKEVFDLLLKLHVINVLLVNRTEDAHLYTYNPFDNYACGRYYDAIISYGLCSQVSNNLYPNKLVNGLRNCTFTTTVSHRPPFAINPSKNVDKQHRQLGVEQYLLKLIAEKEQFEVKFDFNFGSLSAFSTVTPDMQATGPMKRLQTNETEIIIAALLLVKSRAEAFTYLHGHLDYVDEIIFVVKKAPLVAGWKFFYLEFSPIVWCLLLLVFVIYSTLLILLLHSEDKARVILTLFIILLSHSYKIRWLFKVKCVFIMWVWFAYLINNYYLSSLVSFTTQPLHEYQISTEDDIIENNLKACIAPNYQTYLSTETNNFSNLKQACSDSVDTVQMVSKSEDMFTLTQKSFFLYDTHKYFDTFGLTTVFCLQKRYGILLLAMYFYKGFPITERMQITSIRLREAGIVDKSLMDHYNARFIKLHFHNRQFKIRSALPWFAYIVGCALSFLTFVFEIVVKYKNNVKCFARFQ